MGYETKLIIGTLTNSKGFKNKKCDWLNEIASIYLSKCCFYDTYINKDTDTHKVFIYASDGDKEIATDKYGNQLFAIDPTQVLNMMIEDNAKQQYRRYNAAIPLLQSLIYSFNDDLKCILFGY